MKLCDKVSSVLSTKTQKLFQGYFFQLNPDHSSTVNQRWVIIFLRLFSYYEQIMSMSIFTLFRQKIIEKSSPKSFWTVPDPFLSLLCPVKKKSEKIVNSSSSSKTF